MSRPDPVCVTVFTKRFGVWKRIGGKQMQYNTSWLCKVATGLFLFLLAQPLFAQVTLGDSASERQAGTADVQEPDTAPPVDVPAQPLSDQVEDLKQAVLDLNRDLLILEEELLFPANTQVAIFLSMDVGEFFQLDSVKVTIGDTLVASHLYTPQQADALFRGGVQRLYVGNLKSGTHEVTAVFTGIGPSGREYKRGATTSVEKTLQPTMLEMRVVDSTTDMQPVFDIKEWQL